MATRFKDLSDKLLDLTFSRVGNVVLKAVSVSTLFSELQKSTVPMLMSRSLNLILLTDTPQVVGDETLLLSMLQNLVENAARASHPGASITVRAYMDTCPIIEVSDTGCGMEQHEVEKITSPFYRVDKSRSREYGGVGLGLSIVLQIAAVHKAEVKITTEVGVGTIVRILFTTP